MDDIQRSWRHVDFGTGKVIFLDVTRKEDMLQVEYPNWLVSGQIHHFCHS